MIKKPVKIKNCAVCGQLKNTKDNFFAPNSPFYIDGYFFICWDCLDNYLIENSGNWELVDQLCMMFNIPFDPYLWTLQWEGNPTGAIKRYCTMMATGQYSGINWKKYYDKYSEIIKEDENKIHPSFDKEHLSELALIWGDSYTNEELYKLDKEYQNFKRNFGFYDDDHRASIAQKMAKLSISMDKHLANNESIDKDVSAYNNLQKAAGFSAENASDVNSFESIGELCKYIETKGWTKKFHNDEPKDIVDDTIRAIQLHNQRLYRNESTINEQIENKLYAKKLLDDYEHEILSEEQFESLDLNNIIAPLKTEEEEQDFIV